MKTYLTSLLILLALATLSAQSSRGRDALKAGFNYTFLSQQDAFKPGAMLEFTRVFYQPVTIGVGMNYTRAKDIVTSTQNQDLTSFSFDLNGYYAFLENDQSELHLGLGLSARLFKTKWVERDTEFTGTTSLLRPGLNIVLNYNQIFDPLFIGVRTTVQVYSSGGTVYLIGGHMGVKF